LWKVRNLLDAMQGAFAGEFGDAFIKDTNLEGEETHYALFIGEIETDCQVLL
jgi:hypothetical protein